jgi:hypothetical protein
MRMSLNRNLRCIPVAAAIVAGLLVAPVGRTAPTTCHAVSGPRTLPLVELFTSEGCDSCPPADRWLSAQFPAQPQGEAPAPAALALAYHVDYWDRLGWRDRFASAQFTQRQRDELRAGGSAIVYTPQVVVQGHDAPGWNRGLAATAIAAAERRPPRASIAVDVTRTSDALQLRASARVQDPALRKNVVLWIVYADSGHVTDVAAGENRGERLRHDHVVRALHGPFPVDARGDVAAEIAQKPPNYPGIAPSIVAFVQDVGNGDVLQAIAASECP